VSRLRAATGALGAGLLLAALATPASATTSVDPDDGLWYFTATGMDERHERTTGKGIQVAVIDTAINPDVPELADADLHVREPSYCAAETMGPLLPATSDDPVAAHGTSMVSLIVGNGEGIDGERGVLGVAPDAEVHFYSNMALPADADVRCPAPDTNAAAWQFGQAIDQAVLDGADIISISLTTSSGVDAPAIARALHAGVIVVGAQPSDLDGSYPAAFNGVVAVDSIGPDGKLWDGAAGGQVVAPGEQIRQFTEAFDGYRVTNGSSSATAYTSAALALVWSAYPDATSNQILQTLVRNTDGEDHELYWAEGYGYGVVNVRHMLEHDPTTYPDENPLLVDDPDATPSLSEVADPTPLASSEPSAPATSSPSAAPSVAPTTATEKPPAGDDDAGSASRAPLLVGAAALLAALVAVVGLAVRRSRAHQDTSTGPGGPPTTHEPGPDPRGGQ